MRFLRICAFILPLGWLTCTAILAQSPSARVETVAGVHMATFETPGGAIRVHVPSDAAPGDVISGTILAEPGGATAQDRTANQNDLDGFVVEWPGQRTPVSSGRYEWLIPIELRAGTVAVLLRDREGRVVSRASIPIDPVPAVPLSSSPANAFELPADGEIGQTAVIRGRSDGKLSSKAVRLGGVEAALLASSPRRLAFRVPALPPGPVPFRFTSGESMVERTLRVFEIRASASSTQLFRGQRATLTVTVLGLDGITEPMTLSVVNRSPAAVLVEDIDKPITITPSQVKRGGTFVTTRRLVGIQPGPFLITASVSRPPTAQFDVMRSTTRALTDWQARTGVGISAGAGALIQRGVPEAPLQDFLGRQQAYRGDVQEVFAALLSHYCFDLRDDGLSRRRADGRFGTGAGILLVGLGQNRAPDVTITESEVRRLSFPDFVSRLTERFAMRQAVGYLFVRSAKPRAPITIDRKQNGELTDRRFVTPAGDHEIVVTGSQTCRQRVTVNPFQTAVVDCGA